MGLLQAPCSLLMSLETFRTATLQVVRVSLQHKEGHEEEVALILLQYNI